MKFSKIPLKLNRIPNPFLLTKMIFEFLQNLQRDIKSKSVYQEGNFKSYYEKNWTAEPKTYWNIKQTKVGKHLLSLCPLYFC